MQEEACCGGSLQFEKGLSLKKKPKHNILFMKAVQVLILIHFSIFPQNSHDFILEAKNKNFVS